MRPRIADIVTIVARLTNLHEDDLRKLNRYSHFCAARYAVYLTAREWGYSFPAIGRAVGDRDHSTVIHGLANHRRFGLYLEDFDEFCAEVARLADELPPFVAESGWQPSRTFKAIATAKSISKRPPQVGNGSARLAAAKAKKVRLDRDERDQAAVVTSMRKGSAQLLAALTGAA